MNITDLYVPGMVVIDGHRIGLLDNQIIPQHDPMFEILLACE